MVSPNDRLLGQPINGSKESNGLSSHSSSESVANSSTVDDNNTVTINSLVLERLLRRTSFIDSDRQLFIGSESDGNQLYLGSIKMSTQRRSITKELVVVANGLKPVKGSVDKFSVNQISENNESINIYRTEPVIQFAKWTHWKTHYPISGDTNIIASGHNSQLFIKDDHQLIEIRPKDGFVLIDSDFVVIDKREDKKVVEEEAHHYSRHQKGNLLVLGTGVHLLIIDKTKQNESILFVGTGGVSTYSLPHSSNKLRSDHKCSDRCRDRPIVLKKSSYNCAKLNGQQTTNRSSFDCKRQLSDSDNKTKKQKCENWSHSQPFVNSTQS